MSALTKRYDGLARTLGWPEPPRHDAESSNPWERYEARKRELREAGITGADYHRAIDEITRELGI